MIKIKQAAPLCTLSPRHLLTLIFPLVFLLASCGNSGEKIPDVSGIKVALQTQRFDIDFGNIDSNNIGAGVQKLASQYPDFINYYLDTFMVFGFHGHYADTAAGPQDSLRRYLTFRDYVELENTIKDHYPDTKNMDAKLTQGFQFMKYYFPAYTVPKIIYMNMYLSKFPAFAWDQTTFCIGLDWFLGDQFPVYASVGVPAYILPHMRSNYMPVSVFHSIYQSKYTFQTADKPLLDLMLQRGKEQYFLHKILPHTADSVLFGYADHKLNWCAENEGLIYNFFIHQGLLYNKEPANIMPYVTDGPFAVNFPAENPYANTPGNIGTWLGYRIVCAYMAQNPSMTLPQLLDQQIDPAQFLDGAKYRPK